MVNIFVSHANKCYIKYNPVFFVENQTNNMISFNANGQQPIIMGLSAAYVLLSADWLQ